MAVSSTLSIVTPKPQNLQAFDRKPSVAPKTHNATPHIFSCRCSSSSNLTPPVSVKRVFDLGLGLLAASVVALSPMEANATRIEYFATVGEPPCELNFVRSGLGYCDIDPGFGEEVPFGTVYQPAAPWRSPPGVHYTARFADGTVFDSSYKRDRPLTMRLGLRKVIKGLDQGILGGDGVPPMQIGGRRKLQIPPELAYGPEPAGCFSGDCNIPGNATLLYDINVVGIYSGNRK